jgi:hypothetical protein
LSTKDLTPKALLGKTAGYHDFLGKHVGNDTIFLGLKAFNALNGLNILNGLNRRPLSRPMRRILQSFRFEPEDIEARLVGPRSELEKIRMSLCSLRGVKPRKGFPNTLFVLGPKRLSHFHRACRAERYSRIRAQPFVLDRPAAFLANSKLAGFDAL